MPATGTILVIDDSIDDTQLLLRTFEQVGVQNPVHTCQSADEALQYLHSHEPPALMLLDLKMPGKDGLYVLNQIKSDPQFRDLIVIVLATLSDVGVVRLSYELGANSFLTKPLDLSEFRQMVTAFYQYWIITNQPTPKHARWLKPPPVSQQIGQASPANDAKAPVSSLTT